jgi:hypothetical protein
MPRRFRSPRIPAVFVLIIAIAVSPAGRATAAPTPGFLEPFTSTTSGWSGGTNFDNPGTGGVGGAADGFLRLSTGVEFPGSYGVASHAAPEYAGDWIAAGIKTVRFCLNDIGTDQPFEIHFSIGKSQVNVWQSNTPLIPLENQWSGYEVDVTEQSNFTQIINSTGTGTFEEAMRDVDVVHLRHDMAPFVQFPNAIGGDLGIDNFELSDISVPVVPTTWGRIKRLYR